MATTYKILGQSAPVANTYTDMYAVPAATQAVISTLNVCNTNASNVSFRVLARQANAAITSKQFIAYDVPIGAQDAIGLTLGMTLGALDVITVHSVQGNVVFNLFGTEIS